ncbi:MAG: DUF1574 domain-containing protein [Candidatus Obscuribacterales bacterium]|nr:DUF1574 domain-containing protein [Candidatus Obscuribacterales bacterium]
MQQSTISRILFSTTVLSVVLVVAFDLWIGLAHPLAKSPTASLDRTEVYCATNTYEKEVKSPPVVVLGSSLVTAPIMQAESNYHKTAIPRFLHRRSHVLENAIAEKLGSTPDVYCMAVGGEMASDAYLITKRLLKKTTPIAVVYGVAPRDFQDNLMPGIQSSETFRILSDIDDVKDLSQKTTLSFEEQGGLFVERISALARYRADIRSYVALRAKKIIDALSPVPLFEKMGPDLQVRVRRDGWFPEEALGTPPAVPGYAVEHTPEKQVTYEYIRRYNPIAPKFVDAEFGYLNKLFQLCDEKGVSVVVVNMPLSAFNKKLMAKGFYTEYMSRMKNVCAQANAEFVDLNTTEWDAADNFVDSVHLKPEVSQKFLETLADVVSKSQAAIAIKSGKTIAATTQTR